MKLIQQTLAEQNDILLLANIFGRPVWYGIGEQWPAVTWRT